jgi:hypothetical protein
MRASFSAKVTLIAPLWRAALLSGVKVGTQLLRRT